MRIWSSVVDLIIKQARVEYSGTHSPDPNCPLYGRCAYWRIYIGDTYVCKVTARVKTLNPKQATLDKLLRAELQRRIEAIGFCMDVDHYGQMREIRVDPYGVRPLLDLVEGKYMDILKRKPERTALVAV